MKMPYTENMNLNEQISRIRGLIYELAPQSSGVQEFIAQVQEKPELLKHMNFKNMDDLSRMVEDEGVQIEHHPFNNMKHHEEH